MTYTINDVCDSINNWQRTQAVNQFDEADLWDNDLIDVMDQWLITSKDAIKLSFMLTSKLVG